MQKMKRVRSSHTLQDGYKRIPISISIPSTQLVVNQGFFSRNFILYTIKVATSYKTWYISKRYSHFEQLHYKIKEKFRHLPPFPPKRFFRFCTSTINERKSKFEKYLTYLVKRTNICKYEEVIDFLLIDKSLFEIFAKNNYMISSNALNFSILNNSISKMSYGRNSTGDLNSSLVQHNLNSECSMYKDDNYFCAFVEYKIADNDNLSMNAMYNSNTSLMLFPNNEKSISMLVVEEFLRNLSEQKQHKSEIAKTFTAFLKYKNKWHQFKKDEIVKLLTGDTNVHKGDDNDNNNIIITNDDVNQSLPLKGLMYHVGDYKTNLFGSLACLDLLYKLVTYEFNPECELYVYIFRTRHFEFISEMKLAEIAKLKVKGYDDKCFYLINLFISDEKYVVPILRKFGCDDEIEKMFMNWYKTNNKNQHQSFIN